MEAVDVSAAVASLDIMTEAAEVEVAGVNPTMEWPVMRGVTGHRRHPAPVHPTPTVPTTAQTSAAHDKAHRFVRVDAARLDTLMTSSASP